MVISPLFLFSLLFPFLLFSSILFSFYFQLYGSICLQNVYYPSIHSFSALNRPMNIPSERQYEITLSVLMSYPSFPNAAHTSPQASSSLLFSALYVSTLFSD